MIIYPTEVTLENGEKYTLDKYAGKTMLIVNTATKCGLAPQFKELEELYQTYKNKDFIILGFPSNQFKQELKSAHDAAEACRLSYGVSFPMHQIVAVNGEEAHPLFKLLTEATKGITGKAVKWNFTKFLVDKNGNIIKRFAPTTKPQSMAAEIEAYL